MYPLCSLPHRICTGPDVVGHGTICTGCRRATIFALAQVRVNTSKQAKTMSLGVKSTYDRKSLLFAGAACGPRSYTAFLMHRQGSLR